MRCLPRFFATPNKGRRPKSTSTHRQLHRTTNASPSHQDGNRPNAEHAAVSQPKEQSEVPGVAQQNVDDLFNYEDVDNDTDEVDQLTTEMLAVVKAKMANITEDKQAQLESKALLSVVYRQTKDQMLELYKQRRELQRELKRIEMNNMKVEDDCARLDKELEFVAEHIEKVIKDVAAEGEQMTAETERLRKLIESEELALEQQREDMRQRDKGMQEELVAKHKLVEETENELNDLRSKVAVIRSKEVKRLDKFMLKSQSVTVSNPIPQL